MRRLTTIPPVSSRGAGTAPDPATGSAAPGASVDAHYLRTRLPGLAMAGIIVLWGVGPPVSKLITAPPLVIASTRFWASVPILFAVTWATGHRVTRETLRHTWLAGALFGLNMVAVFFSLQRTSVTVLSILMALQPGIVLVVAGRWLGERPSRWHVAWTMVGILGVAIVILGNGPEVEMDALGVVGGVVSLLSFTGYYVRNRIVRTRFEMHPLESCSTWPALSASSAIPS